MSGGKEAPGWRQYMRYFGGKQRIAGRLVAAMKPAIDRANTYVEPFVGGASVLCRVPCANRIAADANQALITMWRAVTHGWWKPPTVISAADYTAVSENRDPTDPITAFVGFGCSFAGKWFGGYARGGGDRNYAANAANSINKKLSGLSGVMWTWADYRDLCIPEDAVVYCDPPYAGATQYNGVGNFDSGLFWAWCREQASRGCTVYVSEYTAPKDFCLVLEVTTKTDIRTVANGKETRIERLFSPRTT